MPPGGRAAGLPRPALPPPSATEVNSSYTTVVGLRMLGESKAGRNTKFSCAPLSSLSSSRRLLCCHTHLCYGAWKTVLLDCTSSVCIVSTPAHGNPFSSSSSLSKLTSYIVLLFFLHLQGRLCYGHVVGGKEANVGLSQFEDESFKDKD